MHTPGWQFDRGSLSAGRSGGRTARPAGGVLTAALTLLVAVVGALNYFWLLNNTIPPHWDSANHMISALKYHAVLSQCFDPSLFTLPGLKHCVGELVYVDRFVYGPLFPFSGGLAVFLAGNSTTALTMMNLPFLAVLIICTYLIGCAFHSRVAGLLAALLVIAYPLVLLFSREFMLEVPMLAMTAAAAYFLIAADRFRYTAATILFGVTLGLGALTKFTLLTFLAGPGVYVFACLLTDIARRRIDSPTALRRLAGLAGTLVLALAIAAVWYWPNRTDFLDALNSVRSVDTTRQPLLATASLMYYVNAMPWHQMGLPLFALFIFGLIRFGPHVSAGHRTFLIVWLGSIYLIHTFGSFKAVHNDIGVLLPAAVISAIGIASLGRSRPVAVAIVIGFAGLQTAVFTLPASFLAARTGTFGWSGDGRPGVDASPRPEDWRVEGALRSLAARPVRVAVVSDHIFINGTTLDFYRMQNDLPAEVAPCWRLGREGTDPLDFSRFDVVLAKSDDGWVRRGAVGCFIGPNGREEYGAVIRRLEDPSAGFALRQSIPLPDGSSLLVFGAQGVD